jgi:hypothetical protein
MARSRTFDHAEAYRLRTQYGWTWTRLARRYNVSIGGISKVVTLYVERNYESIENPEAAMRRRALASVHHLIDFKKSGYSAAYYRHHCEMPPEVVAREPCLAMNERPRPQPAVLASYLGSPADMCAVDR